MNQAVIAVSSDFVLLHLDPRLEGVFRIESMLASQHSKRFRSKRGPCNPVKVMRCCLVYCFLFIILQYMTDVLFRLNCFCHDKAF